VPSARLVAAVEQLGRASYEGPAYRHLASRWNPLSGAGARSIGGRWNPPASFATLYLAVERETAVAEFIRMAARTGRAPEDFLPRRIYRYEARLAGLLDLHAASARAAVDLTDDALRGDDPSKCRAVGEAAEYLGREGIIAPDRPRPAVPRPEVPYKQEVARSSRAPPTLRLQGVCIGRLVAAREGTKRVHARSAPGGCELVEECA
jgi:RES domain-containing protein